MSHMFYECISLRELNISNFNSIHVSNMDSMFYRCVSLKKLYNSDKKIQNKYQNLYNDKENMFLC